jgi:hypothetical protein
VPASTLFCPLYGAFPPRLRCRSWVKNRHEALEMGRQCYPLKADVDQPRLEMTF